jgi:ferredoxin-NADP reductase
MYLTLQEKIPLTHDVWELIYQNSENIMIQPGQFLLCDCDPTNSKLRRSYSVSWAKETKIHLIIKRIADGGGGSQAICDQKIGHEMQVW